MTNVLLLVLSSVNDLYTELKNDRIDGIFMDRFKAEHSLQEINESRFKVFVNFVEKIPYYLAIPENSGLVKVFLDEDSCFKKLIDNSDVDSLLIKYLQPVKVTTTFSFNFLSLVSTCKCSLMH